MATVFVVGIALAVAGVVYKRHYSHSQNRRGRSGPSELDEDPSGSSRVQRIVTANSVNVWDSHGLYETPVAVSDGHDVLYDNTGFIVRPPPAVPIDVAYDNPTYQVAGSDPGSDPCSDAVADDNVEMAGLHMYDNTIGKDDVAYIARDDIYGTTSAGSGTESVAPMPI